MLQKQVSNKQQLVQLLQSSPFRRVLARDIHDAKDIDEIAKSAQTMMRPGSTLTIFVVAN